MTHGCSCAGRPGPPPAGGAVRTRRKTPAAGASRRWPTRHGTMGCGSSRSGAGSPGSGAAKAAGSGAAKAAEAAHMGRPRTRWAAFIPSRKHGRIFHKLLKGCRGTDGARLRTAAGAAPAPAVGHPMDRTMVAGSMGDGVPVDRGWSRRCCSAASGASLGRMAVAAGAAVAGRPALASSIEDGATATCRSRHPRSVASILGRIIAVAAGVVVAVRAGPALAGHHTARPDSKMGAAAIAAASLGTPGQSAPMKAEAARLRRGAGRHAPPAPRARWWCCRCASETRRLASGRIVRLSQ